MPTVINVDSPSREAFQGRTAIVTGGCSGIGLTTAKLLHSLGCNVVMGDLRPPEQYNEDAVFSSPKLQYHHCDVTSWKSLESLFAKTVSLFGSIDIVSANAGVDEKANAFFSPSETECHEPNMGPIDINIKGTFYTAHLAMHHMKKNKRGGSIVITASMAGYFPQHGLPLYTASKSALIGFLRVMAVDCLPYGIAVSTVAPGLTETAMMKTLLDRNEVTTASMEDQLREFFKKLQAMGIPSQSPDIVAKAIVHLAQQGRQAAGHSLYVQGGEVIELEQELRKSMPGWLNEKMRFMFPDAPTWGKVSGSSDIVQGKL